VLDSTKEFFFEKTLGLAKKGWGDTHPNPMVGAIIVEEGKSVAEGYHRKTGGPHAEVEAFKSLGRKPAPGASIFISLEPCSTTGRTPPCVDAIIESGIKIVYVGTLDPNPAHAGRGLEILRKAGVTVEMASDEFGKQASRLNFIFNLNITKKRPLLALKLAESSNGKLSEVAGEKSRVTEEDARLDVMHWRRLFPAICVGSGTVLADNPSLTSRQTKGTFCPVRLVLDSSLRTLHETVSPRNLYRDAFTSKTIILTTASGMNNLKAVKKAHESGINLIELGQQENGQIQLNEIPDFLKKLNLNALYFEGGSRVANSLLKEGLVDYLFRYQSPKIFSGPNALPGPDLDSFPLREPIKAQLGEDRIIHGFL
jgi:diaminohydroxyphosphoribosylaminopyrimidine deaminase/5-amino-6-(5-phosphoribosylamino)uracil reductase